jgi:hypothetical protein
LACNAGMSHCRRWHSRVCPNGDPLSFRPTNALGNVKLPSHWDPSTPALPLPAHQTELSICSANQFLTCPSPGSELIPTHPRLERTTLHLCGTCNLPAGALCIPRDANSFRVDTHNPVTTHSAVANLHATPGRSHDVQARRAQRARLLQVGCCSSPARRECPCWCHGICCP